MGCTCVTEFRADSTSEDMIQAQELVLGFEKQQATEIATEVKVYSSGGTLLHRQQLRNILVSLDLYSEGLDKTTSPLYTLFSCFAQGKRYEARKLAVLAVLLGLGSMEKKAEVLISLYGTNEVLTENQVTDLVTDSCDVALVYLPKYSVSMLEQLNDLQSVRKLASYQRKLTAARSFTVAKLTEKLMQSKFGIDLQDLMTSTAMKTLCAAQEIRRFAATLYRDMPQASKEAVSTPTPTRSRSHSVEKTVETAAVRHSD